MATMPDGSSEPRRPFTATDLARLLGLAQSTVSMALANDARISAETRAKVAEAAARLGYQPNRVARAMRTGRSHLVGVLVPSLRISFFTDLIDAIEAAATAAGYRCLLAHSRSNPALFDREVELLLAQQVDGLLLCPANPFSECAFSHRLPTLRLPTVLIDHPQAVAGIPGVVSDWTQIGRLAADHLLALGHRRIMTVQVVARQTAGRPAILAAREAVGAGGGSLVALDLDESRNGFDAMAEDIRTALAAHPEVTALLVTDDCCAVAAIRAGVALGRRIPEALSVVSCAALDLGRWSTPTVTAVDQRPRRQGERAMQLLIERIGGQAGYGLELLEGALLAGGTTAPPTP